MKELIQYLKAFIPDAFKWEKQWDSDLDPEYRERLKLTIETAAERFKSASKNTDGGFADRMPANWTKNFKS